MEMKELSSVLQQNGVVGAGGAGFPTYAKLDERAETIILNCAECEPLLRLHRQLLEKHAYEIMSTFYLIAETVGAKEAIIGIKKAYKKTIEALEANISAFPNMKIGLLDEVYPAGDEVVLIYEVTGKVVKPGSIPIESGVAVFNVETVYNLYRALHDQHPVVDKLVSVVAEVNNPVTVRVPLGTTIDEVVALAGGATIPDPVYFMGGPMMGYIGSGQDVVTKTTNAVLVLPEDHLIIQKKKGKAKVDLARAAASCCQCSMCTDLCPRHALGHPIEPHLFMRAATCKDIQEPEIFINTLFCSSCGLCEMYSCFQGLSPRTLMAEYKGGLRSAGVKVPKVEPAPVEASREYRKIPMERLMSRLGLTKYNVDAPLHDDTVYMKRVKIMLRQHIGAPAQPVVAVGDSVTMGQVIAAPAKGLSVAIHASISGKVIEVNNNFIIIDANN
ncbi:MAG: SLBB domain-containing protein [Lachnospiraceae bacterium]